MGSSRWDPDAWSTHASATVGKSAADIFSRDSVSDDLDAKNIKFRESVDSPANPASTPIIIGVDVTGSMGILAENIVRRGLGVVMQGIYDRKPVSDPHIAIMAIGDAYIDSHPLQVTQFEASIVLADQMQDIYLEGGGGGNQGESYLLAHYFAALRVKADSMMKRNRRGYLFTIGDEAPLPTLTAGQIRKHLGDGAQADMSAVDLLHAAQQSWEVYHLIVSPVPQQPVVEKWTELLGERAVRVSDVDKLSEVIVSLIQVNEGADASAVAASWSGDTALVVAAATRGVTRGGAAGAGVRL